jgi:hypothetical protein
MRTIRWGLGLKALLLADPLFLAEKYCDQELVVNGPGGFFGVWESGFLIPKLLTPVFCDFKHEYMPSLYSSWPHFHWASFCRLIAGRGQVGFYHQRLKRVCVCVCVCANMHTPTFGGTYFFEATCIHQVCQITFWGQQLDTGWMYRRRVRDAIVQYYKL